MIEKWWRGGTIRKNIQQMTTGLMSGADDLSGGEMNESNENCEKLSNQGDKRFSSTEHFIFVLFPFSLT